MPLPAVIPTVTPLGVISLAISTVIAPLVAWLTKNGVEVLKQVNTLQGTVQKHETELSSLCTKVETSDRRLIKVEEAVTETRAVIQRLETSLATISTKLDALPRLEATVQSQAALLSKVVPREEIDRLFSQHDRRIGLVEQDIRKA